MILNITNNKLNYFLDSKNVSKDVILNILFNNLENSYPENLDEVVNICINKQTANLFGNITIELQDDNFGNRRILPKYYISKQLDKYWTLIKELSNLRRNG